jgi:hypothetical protein
MNGLSEYMARTGRTPDEVATDLTALLGKKIGAGGVRLHSSRAKTPKAWAEALGISDTQPEPERPFDDIPLDASLGEPGMTRDDGEPPAPPPGARVTTRAPGGTISLQAKARIEMAYTAVGAGATLITSNKGYEDVASNYAPTLADAWLKAAETNPTIAKIVRFMESGGPVGELVVGHVILVLGFAYISGRGPDLDIIYGKFAGHRANAIATARVREAEAHLNGSGTATAEGVVGQPTS